MVKRISKTYKMKKKGKGIFSREKINVNAVENLSFKIPKGKIIGLLGINGAGKTTTIKMLSSLITPTSGNIYIDGINIKDHPLQIKSVINIISGGERSIYWRLTGRENLEYFGGLYGLNPTILKQTITNILKIVSLENAADIAVEKYSKGMKQRLQIARGLINNPDYIFLDEPTLGLDIMVAKEFRGYIKKLAIQENKGILLTTHYMSEADDLCDYVYVIDKGKIVSQGTPHEIKEKYGAGQNYQVIYEHEISESILADLKSISGVVSIQNQPKSHSLDIKSIVNPIIQINKILDNYDNQIIQFEHTESTLENSIMNILQQEKNDD